PFSFSGEHYTITELDGLPKPLQQPHPAIFIGSGGRRLLSFAANEADIVGITLRARREGGTETREATKEKLSEKVGWVKDAAGERFGDLELNILLFKTIVTDNPEAAAEQIAGMPLSATERYRKDAKRSAALTPELILASPHFQLGSVQQIVENLQALREQYGVSNFGIYPEDVETFSPVVEQLAGR
ncbi:MAG: LLM class flavin-dependent oxidoreductase, partial [Acidimicrobiia bacterium]